MATKFKVGDRVEVISRFSQNSSGYGKLGKGTIAKENMIGNATSFWPKEFCGKPRYTVENEDRNYVGLFVASELKLLTPKTQYPVIVHCSTKKDWDRVQKKAFKDGFEWSDGKKLTDKWTSYKEISCIAIGAYNDMKYSPRSYWVNNEPNIPIITANEYLNTSGDKDTVEEKSADIEPQKKTIMSVIKNAFKSKEQKALSYFNLTNGDGGLTSEGRHEFNDYLWEIMKSEKAEFVKKIVKAYEEEMKKK